MITIKDLLNKIKWDEKETESDYVIYYYDRIAKKQLPISLNETRIDDGIMLVPMDYGDVSVPLHRIRKVEKVMSGKKEIIW